MKSKFTQIFITILLLLLVSCGGHIEGNLLGAKAGTSSSPFDSGDGASIETAYRVSTANQVVLIGQVIGSTCIYCDNFFQLTSDIDLSLYSFNDPAIIGDTPRGNSFSGYFDGGGYEITGLSHPDASVSTVGLFGTTTATAVIKNFTLENVNIQGAFYVGALVGKNYGIVRNIVVTGSISGNGYVGGIVGINYGLINGVENQVTVTGTNNIGGISGTNYGSISNSFSSGAVQGVSTVGGISGYNYEGNISFSYSTGNVTATGDSIGGIVGHAPKSTISNCYSEGDVVGNDSVGGLVGKDDSSTRVYNSYATGDVTGNDQVGGLYGSKFTQRVYNSFATGNVTANSNFGRLTGGMNVGLNTNCYVYSGSTCGVGCNSGENGSHGTLSSFFDKANAPLSSWDYNDNLVDGKSDIWVTPVASFPKLWMSDASLYVTPFLGSGTESEPYLISSVTEFNRIDSNPRWIGLNFKLTSDLDFTAQSFAALGKDSFFYFAGVFDGDSYSISNITINDNTQQYMGIFERTNRIAIIKNLNVLNIDFTGGYHVSGLAAFNYGIINNVNLAGSISSTAYSGGIAGTNRGTIIDSSFIGGASSISGGYIIGGLVGDNYNTIENSFSTVDVTGTNQSGGLVGHNDSGIITDSYATGSVTGDDNVGGLIGRSWNGGSLSRVYATGSVDGDNDVGGLVGENSDEISNSYALGNVTGVANSGGFIGRNASSRDVSYSFSKGSVANVGIRGGFVGLQSSGTYSGCFWDTTTSGQADAYNGSGGNVAGVLGQATASMLQQATYTDWDFTQIWNIDENVSYPYLR